MSDITRQLRDTNDQIRRLERTEHLHKVGNVNFSTSIRSATSIKLLWKDKKLSKSIEKKLQKLDLLDSKSDDEVLQQLKGYHQVQHEEHIGLFKSQLIGHMSMFFKGANRKPPIFR